jgi:hypothetical protein
MRQTGPAPAHGQRGVTRGLQQQAQRALQTRHFVDQAQLQHTLAQQQVVVQQGGAACVVAAAHGQAQAVPALQQGAGTAGHEVGVQAPVSFRMASALQ